MRPILESLALHLVRREGSRLGELRIILPNRRSGIFLEHHLAKHAGTVTWAPRIYAIADYIQETSMFRSADPVALLFRCYDIYCGMVDDPDPFEIFFPWGEMMIRDFDELDKYMVDAGMLFSNFLDLKELEEPLAGLGPEQMQFIRRFWEGFHEGGRSPEKSKFLENWQRLPQIYLRFREELASGGEGYLGMQYREIAERIAGGKIVMPHADRTIIAGFNALSASEKEIFTRLRDQGAEFYWDYDHRYVDEEIEEAGRFMRENLRTFPQATDLEDFRGLGQEKQIRIYEVPSDILQAKAVHRILLEEDTGSEEECTDTALVLCDEALLMPVISSIPGTVQEVNVTMGYPLKQSSAFTLIDALVRLQLNARRDREGRVQFYHRDVATVLSEPLIKFQGEDPASAIMEEISRKNLVMVDAGLFTGPLERMVFRLVEGAGVMLDYFRGIFMMILDESREGVGGMHPVLDRESIFQVLRYLNRLEVLLAGRQGITSGMAAVLLQRMLATVNVPFEGEPLSGLQVMGILETRMLDFRHVILLSMNEDVIPASHPRPSYIPYSLRLAYGMPAREEMDAIYAYNFHRLLQRAEKVDLLYNSASEGVRTGEMSRYLHQYFFREKARIFRPGMEISEKKSFPLEIPRGPMVETRLKRYYETGTDERFLSPSALNTYLDCPLRFYFRYMAGIGEPEEVLEEIDAPGFGTVLHESMRLLYTGLCGGNSGMVERPALETLLRSDVPEETVKEVFLAHQFRGRRGAVIEGRDIIVFRVMLRYLQRIIRTDMETAPFEVISLEETFRRRLGIMSGGKEIGVLLGGKVDRVDRAGGILRVIDYKTGDARLQFPSLDALFNPSLSGRNGAALQTLFYAWLVSPGHRGERVLPGLYVMRALYGEYFDPALSMGTGGQKIRIEDFSSVEDQFVDLLKALLGTLFDPSIPFVRTENRTKCRYCQFAAICNRESIE